ncbi:hypothetical protein YPPY103_0733, partial [Yersinia pestis PY-103]
MLSAIQAKNRALVKISQR